MIRDKKIAAIVLREVIAINERLLKVAAAAGQQAPEDEKAIRLASAQVSAELLFRFVNPICKEHPELTPPEMLEE